MYYLPVGVVNEGSGLATALVEGPSQNGQTSGQKPQVIVAFNETTIGSKSTPKTCENQELAQVPRLKQTWLLFAESHEIPGERVSTEDSVDLGNFLRRDLTELLAKSE